MKPCQDSSSIADNTAQPATGIAEISWEQKFHAIKALCSSATIEMRRPGDWYVSANMEHASGECCLVSDYGNGSSPEAAVRDHWCLYGNGDPFLVSMSDPNCGWFRWNGFMWEHSTDPRKDS